MKRHNPWRPVCFILLLNHHVSDVTAVAPWSCFRVFPCSVVRRREAEGPVWEHGQSFRRGEPEESRRRAREETGQREEGARGGQTQTAGNNMNWELTHKLMFNIYIHDSVFCCVSCRSRAAKRRNVLHLLLHVRLQSTRGQRKHTVTCQRYKNDQN